MKITNEEVIKIANLSRLALEDKDVEIFGRQLNTIIEYVEQLNRLDTSGIEPTSHVLPLNNVMRDDIHSDSLNRQNALQNAPDCTEKFYRVPQIIEQ